jgi:hypothetical protein
MTKPKVICWDLDETLGFFRNIVSVRNKERYPNPDDSYTLRKDIIKTLHQMVKKGYNNVITSSAKLHYTEGIVEAVCLDAYFAHVLGRRDVTDGIWGKKYLPAAELYQLDENDASSNMIVIANMASDEPIDVGVVFIHDQRPLEESALIYETITDTLWSVGEGNFGRGFEAFFSTGKKISCLDGEFNFMLVSTKITDDITAEMGYKNSPRTEGLKVPIIMNIRSS